MTEQSVEERYKVRRIHLSDEMGAVLHYPSDEGRQGGVVHVGGEAAVQVRGERQLADSIQVLGCAKIELEQEFLQQVPGESIFKTGLSRGGGGLARLPRSLPGLQSRLNNCQQGDKKTAESAAHQRAAINTDADVALYRARLDVLHPPYSS
jgi:hypothetical protein